MSRLPMPTQAVATVAGRALGGAAAAVARLRSDRPLHPKGTSYAAVATVTGLAGSGVPWLDTAGTHDVVLRVSRAAGLPRRVPDIQGIAVRLETPPGNTVDLLFATTGSSGLGRFLLQPRMAIGGATLTTLLPVRGPRGPLVLRLRGEETGDTGYDGLPGRLVLSWATGTGEWHDVGHLEVGARLDDAVDEERHDPVVHQLPGTEQYPAVQRLREPAYRAARSQSPGR